MGGREEGGGVGGGGRGLQPCATQPAAIKAPLRCRPADVWRTRPAISDVAVFGLQISDGLHFPKLACLLPAVAMPCLFAYKALSLHGPPRLCLRFSGTIGVHGATAALRRFQLSPPVIISRTASLQHCEKLKSKKRFKLWMSYLLSQVIESTLQLMFLRLIHVEQLSFISVSISERGQRKLLPKQGMYLGREKKRSVEKWFVQTNPIFYCKLCYPATTHDFLFNHTRSIATLDVLLCCVSTPEPNRVVSQAHSSKPHQSLTKPPESSHVQMTQLFSAFLITCTQLNYY